MYTKAAANKGKLGKSAEKDLQNVLKDLSTFREFLGWRLPDARAGSATAAIADFQLLHSGTAIFLEVKEVDHEFRLPYGNFDTDQVARMRRAEMAGALAVAAVYFTPAKLWRLAHINYFRDRSVGASWDMRDCQAAKLEAFINRNTFSKLKCQLHHCSELGSDTAKSTLALETPNADDSQ